MKVNSVLDACGYFSNTLPMLIRIDPGIKGITIENIECLKIAAIGCLHELKEVHAR